MGATTDFTVTPRPIYHADGAQVARLLHGSARAARPADRPAGRVPALHLLGADGGPLVVALDRARGGAAAARGVARPADGLPPAPRLRPPALRPRRAASPPRRRASSTACSATWSTSRASAATPSSSCPSTGSPTRGGPVDVNRALRRAGLLNVYTQAGMEYLDPWTSRAFAVADHQVAHVYVRDPGDVAAARDGARRARRDRPRARGRRAARRGARPRARRRARPRRRAGRLVHVLLLARRRARARLRAPGRDPPQAGLRPRRAVHGPVGPAGEGARGRGARAQEDRHALRDVGRPARPVGGAGDARAAARRRRATRPVFLCSDASVARDRIAAVDVRDVLLELGGVRAPVAS